MREVEKAPLGSLWTHTSNNIGGLTLEMNENQLSCFLMEHCCEEGRLFVPGCPAPK